MGYLIAFRKPVRLRPDIEFTGANEFYTLQANTESGREFVLRSLDAERWWMAQRMGAVVEGSLQAQAIAAGALKNGCRVWVNGREL
jgi:hypothetical protein